MTTFNLEQDPNIDPTTWTVLQTEICMNVATAKREAFIAEAVRMAEYVRLKIISRAMAADYLREAAIYNQLIFEYGEDDIQAIMSVALSEAAA
jgi:hypothetical protein